MDLSWLDKAIKNKPDGYKTWLTKQHTGFCGTRIQVGDYVSQINGDSGCPNCGEKKTVVHLCVCPDEGRTKLLTEMVEELESWMERDGETQVELA